MNNLDTTSKAAKTAATLYGYFAHHADDVRARMCRSEAKRLRGSAVNPGMFTGASAVWSLAADILDDKAECIEFGMTGKVAA